MQHVSPVDGSALAMAETARNDPAITLNDIVAHAENVAALQDWAQGIEFDTEGVRLKLLEQFPHLKDR